MLRWMILSCVTLALAVADARAADQTGAPKPKRHASPHYKARTTIVYGAPPPPVVVRVNSPAASLPLSVTVKLSVPVTVSL